MPTKFKHGFIVWCEVEFVHPEFDLLAEFVEFPTWRDFSTDLKDPLIHKKVLRTVVSLRGDMAWSVECGWVVHAYLSLYFWM